jgi:hypothetical protein
LQAQRRVSAQKREGNHLDVITTAIVRRAVDEAPAVRKRVQRVPARTAVQR